MTFVLCAMPKLQIACENGITMRLSEDPGSCLGWPGLLCQPKHRQAACEGNNSLMYACIFWNLSLQPLNDIQTGKMENPPKLVIDAKALFDVLSKEEIRSIQC